MLQENGIIGISPRDQGKVWLCARGSKVLVKGANEKIENEVVITKLL
jgi:hypothetical protein